MIAENLSLIISEFSNRPGIDFINPDPKEKE
jgi:hypothetical protein